MNDWLENLFMFENCHECGQGAEAHEVFYVFGKPFAFCKEVK